MHDNDNNEATLSGSDLSLSYTITDWRVKIFGSSVKLNPKVASADDEESPQVLKIAGFLVFLGSNLTRCMAEAGQREQLRVGYIDSLGFCGGIIC